MQLSRSKFAQTLILAGFAALFALAAQLVTGITTDNRNRQQIGELAEQMLRRSELGVDYAFIALGKIAENATVTASTPCSETLKSTLRQSVFKHATIKDFRILDRNGKILCSAFPETVASTSSHIDLTPAVAAQNTGLRLMHLRMPDGDAMAVVWTIGSDRKLMAIVNTSALLFDILPPGIRDHSAAKITLNGVAPSVATFAPDGWNPAAGDLDTFTAHSKRFPLNAVIRVQEPALAAWNHSPNHKLNILAGLLGLIFGALVIKTVFREPHPVDAIDKALAAHEFEPYFQPIFSLETGETVGCEMLARWVKPDGSIIPPYQFIPLAEQTGRIVPMTWQLVDLALIQMRPYLRKNKSFYIAFNIGASQLLQPGFTDDLRRHVTGAKVGSRNIVIELTEREELLDLDKARELLSGLQERGYTIALDDAGTGHSGLSYVQKLGANVIKIDKLFVDSVVTERSARVLIELLVNLARELGMTTVAEGIETQEQADVLRALGVDRGQGYLVSPPVNGAKFQAMLDLNIFPGPDQKAARAA
ncbi:MAG: EAL domain-containing protein [Hyphomicrobiales bacterium]|nr:EAL domain-containing protein [Hyphomicrobiales bacterium]